MQNYEKYIIVMKKIKNIIKIELKYNIYQNQNFFILI
jgi:hypothetical protein